jgi:hypothetical protein
MKNVHLISILTAPIDFLTSIWFITWPISIGTLLWLIARRFAHVEGRYRLSMSLCSLTLLMGLIEIVCLVAWFMLFQKDNLGLPYYGYILSSLPIIIPAIAILFFCLRNKSISMLYSKYWGGRMSTTWIWSNHRKRNAKK